MCKELIAFTLSERYVIYIYHKTEYFVFKDRNLSFVKLFVSTSEVGSGVLLPTE